MTPWRASRKAIEKIPADSAPCTIGVSETCQVAPPSAEWNTLAAFPPVANQMLGSVEAVAWAEGRFIPRIATQVFDAANAPSPSTASGIFTEETAVQV